MIPASRQRNFLQSALYVAIAAILAAVLLERLLTYAEAAEKVAMEASLGNLRSVLYARLALYVLQGDAAAIVALETQSPFRLTDPRGIQSTFREGYPRGDNYLGEFDGEPIEAEPSGQWYFDRKRRELVYRPRLKRYFEAETAEARFRVQIRRAPSGAHVGVSIDPVTQYRWEPLP